MTDVYVYTVPADACPVKTYELSDQVYVDKCHKKIVGVEILNAHHIDVDGVDIVEQRDRFLDALKRIAADRCFVEDIMGSPCRERGGSWKPCGACIATETLKKG
jgi:hypothetical protein